MLPAFGYVYVALALPALILGPNHDHAQPTFLTGAIFGYLWFLASLRARLVRFDPDGFFASVVVLGGAAFLVLQGVPLTSGLTAVAAPSSACAATVIIGSSPAARGRRQIGRGGRPAGGGGG